MNGEELRMGEEETKQERVMAAEDGSELLLVWSLQYSELGNAVEIVTGAPPISSYGSIDVCSYIWLPSCSHSQANSARLF